MWPFKSTRKTTDESKKLNREVQLLRTIVRRLIRKLTSTKEELGRIKRGLAELGKDRQDLLTKLSRIEGVLGIGLSLEGETPKEPVPLDLQERIRLEEEERQAIEQLGTGGSFTFAEPPPPNESEGEG